MVVGVTHRFFEFALLEVLSNVLALLGRLSNTPVINEISRASNPKISF